MPHSLFFAPVGQKHPSIPRVFVPGGFHVDDYNRFFFIGHDLTVRYYNADVAGGEPIVRIEERSLQSNAAAMFFDGDFPPFTPVRSSTLRTLDEVSRHLSVGVPPSVFAGDVRLFTQGEIWWAEDEMHYWVFDAPNLRMEKFIPPGRTDSLVRKWDGFARVGTPHPFTGNVFIDIYGGRVIPVSIFEDISKITSEIRTFVNDVVGVPGPILQSELDFNPRNSAFLFQYGAASVHVQSLFQYHLWGFLFVDDTSDPIYRDVYSVPAIVGTAYRDVYSPVAVIDDGYRDVYTVQASIEGDYTDVYEVPARIIGYNDVYTLDVYVPTFRDIYSLEARITAFEDVYEISANIPDYYRDIYTVDAHIAIYQDVYSLEVELPGYEDVYSVPVNIPDYYRDVYSVDAHIAAYQDVYEIDVALSGYHDIYTIPAEIVEYRDVYAVVVNIQAYQDVYEIEVDLPLFRDVYMIDVALPGYQDVYAIPVFVPAGTEVDIDGRTLSSDLMEVSVRIGRSEASHLAQCCQCRCSYAPITQMDCMAPACSGRSSVYASYGKAYTLRPGG